VAVEARAPSSARTTYFTVVSGDHALLTTLSDELYGILRRTSCGGGTRPSYARRWQRQLIAERLYSARSGYLRQTGLRSWYRFVFCGGGVSPSYGGVAAGVLAAASISRTLITNALRRCITLPARQAFSLPYDVVSSTAPTLPCCGCRRWRAGFCVLRSGGIILVSTQNSRAAAATDMAYVLKAGGKDGERA